MYVCSCSNKHDWSYWMLLLLCVDGQCPLDIDFDVCNSTDFGKCQLFITYNYVATLLGLFCLARGLNFCWNVVAIGYKKSLSQSHEIFKLTCQYLL